MSAFSKIAEKGAATVHFCRSGNLSPRSNEIASCVDVVRSARTGTESILQKVISARGGRRKFLPGHLFADPAWDMLLDLYLADIVSKRISISSLCGASQVPATTALRWIAALQSEGLVDRTSDPLDQRRYFMSLSEKGLAAMDQFFGCFGAVEPGA
jgi:hypothetical protein